MTILTNFPRFPEQWISHGHEGRAIFADSFAAVRRRLPEADLVLINCDPALLFRIAALFALAPRLRRPLVASDLVLREPGTFAQRMALPLKRLLLGRVDHFIHHFKDLSGYERWYGIGAKRSSFVPFKPNLRYRSEAEPDPDGEYVLCFGWSLRDYDTFFDAVERLPWPAAIVRPDFARLRQHGARFTRPLDALPARVRVLDHVPSDLASQAEVLRRARIVVLPLRRSCMVGVGTALNAMLFGKCVIMSEGPQTRGLYRDELIAVPPEDAGALAAAIDQAWRDRDQRLCVAAAGRRYALALGGEAELRQRVLDAALDWMAGRPPDR